MTKLADAFLVGAASVLGVKKAFAQKKPPRWAMVIDLRRCVGCFSCQVSCKMEKSVPMGVFNSRVNVFEMGDYPHPKRFFLPVLCNHCNGEKKGPDQVPPCVEKCPEAKAGKRAEFMGVRYREGATYKRPDGVVVVDNSLCIGCGKCIEACPYGARYFNPYVKLTRPDRERDFGIGKCDFCKDRIDQGLEPACVRNCIGKARKFGDLNDPNSEVSMLLKKYPSKVLKPEKKTDPQVFYIGLDGRLESELAKIEEFLNQKVKVKK